jgi:hypothetical protein
MEGKGGRDRRPTIMARACAHGDRIPSSAIDRGVILSGANDLAHEVYVTVCSECDPSTYERFLAALGMTTLQKVALSL